MATKIQRAGFSTPVSQIQSIADEFNVKTKDLDPVKRERIKQRVGSMITQQYGEDAFKEFDTLAPVEAPSRGFMGAVSDIAKYGGIAIDAAQQPFYDLIDPSGAWARENREEKKALEQNLSTEQRLADYRAQQNMARAKAAGESGVGAWLENAAESPLRQGSELFASILPAAATTVALANPYSVAATGGTSLAALPTALGGLGATQAVGAQRGDIYERVLNAKDEDLLKLSPEYLKLRQNLSEQDAKKELGTRIQGNLGTLAGAAAIGGITDRFGGAALRTLLSGGAKGIGAKAAGVAKEAITEGIGEGGEQVLSNVAYRNIDPRQSLTEDVALNAALGAVAGGGLGTASAVGGAFRQTPESVVDKILGQDVTPEQAAALGLPAPTTLLGLPEPEGYSQRVKQGYQDPLGGYATVAQGQGVIEGQDLRGQTPIEMGAAFGYPQAVEKRPYQDTEDVQRLIELAASKAKKTSSSISKEVQQRIEEAADQAPLSIQERLEKAKQAKPDQFIEVASDYVKRKPQVQYIEPQGTKVDVYDYDAALRDINNDMEAILDDYNTKSIASVIADMGGISIDERNDLTGMKDKASQRYVGLFRDNARSLHDLLNDGSLNDYLPQEMRILPTSGEPMDTQPAYNWIGDKLRSEDVRIANNAEAEYMIQSLDRAAQAIQEAASQDTDFINYKAWKAQQPIEQDFYQTTGTKPRESIAEPEKTYAQKNVDEANQVLESIYSALTEDQKNQIAGDDLLELGRLIHGSRFDSSGRISKDTNKPAKTDTATRKSKPKAGDADTGVARKKRVQPKRTTETKRETKASVKKTEGGNTRENIEEKIKSVFGDRALLNVDLKESKDVKNLDENVQAFYNPETKRITIVADRINKGEEISVYLHEIFHKNKAALGKKYSELVNRVNKWESAKDGSIEKEIYTEAKERADQSGETGLDYDEEFIAYAIEEAVNRGVEINPNKVADNTAEGFMAYVYRVFTNALKKLVPSYKGKLSANDLVSIAYGLANIDIQTDQQIDLQKPLNEDKEAEIVARFANEEGAPTEAQTREALRQIKEVEQKYSKELESGDWKSITPTGKPSELTKEQWIQVRTDNFKKWFGDWEKNPKIASKVTNEETGEPLVVYHGTQNNDFYSFDPKKQTHTVHGHGFYFAEDKSIASGYSNKEGRIINAFISMKKPIKGEEKGFGRKDLTNIVKSLLSLELEKYKDEISDYKDSFLSNVSDTYSVSENEAVKDMVSVIYEENDSKADQIANMANIFGDRVLPLQAVINSTGFDGILVSDFENTGTNVYVSWNSAQIKSATDNIGVFSPESPDIRFSRSKKVEDIEDFAKDGKIKDSDSLIQAMKNQTMALYLSGKKDQALGFGDRMLTALADSLLPVVRWIDDLKIPEQTKATFKGAMYRAAGMRDYQNEYINKTYIQKFNKQIAKMYHDNKHKYSEEELKRIVGYWMSARHSIEANKRLIKQDRLELQRAQNEHTQKNTKETKAAVDKAQKELNERLDAVAGRTKGKVAGGFSDPKAKKIMADFEKLVGRQALDAASKPLYDSLQYKLKIDLESGKITQDQYDEWIKEKTYVPLTGDPRSLIEEDEDDFISSGGGANQQRDRAMKGRVSVAEDGVDATIRALSKSTAFYGWKPFKDMLNSVYEQALQKELSTGLSMDKAKEAVAEDYGIIRSGRMGMARTTDKVIFSKVMGKDVQFQLKDSVIDALQGTYIEDLNSGFVLIGVPTRWMARGVTQFTPQFGALNMIRDVLEKDTFVRSGVNKAYDSKGNVIPNGKIANTFLANIISTQFRDTMKAAWKGDFSGKYGKDLKTLMEKGGLSTVGQFLSSTEQDVINDIQKETKAGKIVISKAVKAVESFNQMFDLMPSLALYRAYISNGVDAEQAASLTLDTMNFRKRGSKMALPRALYMFAQPTVTGAVNLGRTLKTRNGKILLASYIAAGYALYSALRAMDDEDEGGNKMDQLGDVTRVIPIPLPNGKYIKIPVGFGLPQLAWNFAVNSHKAINGDISKTDAFSNVAFHWAKVISPVSPSEIPASKYLGAKIALTLTPSIFSPFAQNFLDRNAFGSTIKTGFARSDKLKAEQAKSTTAEFWKEAAVEIQRKTGWDFHPEQIKNLVDGYSLSVMRDAVNIFIENPNRKELGRETKTPLINSLYGAGNEFAIQSRYYEALEEARAVKAEYDSRVKRGDVDGFLTPENKKIIDWYNRAEKNERAVSTQKSKATKIFNKGNMTDEKYRNIVTETVKKREGVQRPLLNEWRRMKGLHTNNMRK